MLTRRRNYHPHSNTVPPTPVPPPAVPRAKLMNRSGASPTSPNARLVDPLADKAWTALGGLLVPLYRAVAEEDEMRRSPAERASPQRASRRLTPQERWLVLHAVLIVVLVLGAVLVWG